jgi:acyl-CoA thioesterase FadM
MTTAATRRALSCLSSSSYSSSSLSSSFARRSGSKRGFFCVKTSSGRCSAPARNRLVRANNSNNNNDGVAVTHRTEFDVYIEDTDHYSVVYYANYFQFCARAFEDALRGFLLVEKNAEYDVLCTHVESAKYVTPAILGDRICVESTIIAEENEGERKSWIVEHAIRKTTTDGDEEDKMKLSFTCRVRYSSLRGGARSSNGNSGSSSSSGSEIDKHRATSIRLYASDKHRATSIRLYASELNHRSVWHVDVLRWFERNRTDLIGGPRALESLKSKDECVVVVSSISDVHVLTDHIESLEPTASLLSFSSVRFLRRDVQCEFDQRVVSLADPDKVLARGKVTCTVLKRDSMRPRSSPESLKARLMG